jgi:putative effector of murein hydrolase
VTGDFAVWVYLSRTPLLWLTVTLLAYVVADRIALATRRHPLANPVLIAIALTAAVLELTKTPYATYFEGAQFVHFLLGPATVALAIPLYEYRATVLRSLAPMLAALGVGSVVALSSALLLGQAFGIPRDVVGTARAFQVNEVAGAFAGIALGFNAFLTAILAPIAVTFLR